MRTPQARRIGVGAGIAVVVAGTTALIAGGASASTGRAAAKSGVATIKMKNGAPAVSVGEVNAA